MDTKCTEPMRDPISKELLTRFNELADRAHTLAQRAVGSLEPIMRDSSPQCPEEEGCPEEPYPPLFTEYRSTLYQIQNSLDTIEDCLERSEI